MSATAGAKLASSPAQARPPEAPARPLEGPSGVLLSAVCYGLNAAPAREAASLGVAGPDLAAARNVLLFGGVFALAVTALIGKIFGVAV